MGRIINPATGKPFVQVNPTTQIVKLRKQIMRALSNSYDAAQTTSQNELHWAAADELSPNSANKLAVRKKLRSRSRYEIANSGYLKGILLSICNDFVGSGPTLQITDETFTETEIASIERMWKKRSKKMKLRRKLWRLEMAKRGDGEAFSFAFTNRKMIHGTKIDQKVVECDQVTHHEVTFPRKKNQPPEIDGIRFSKVSGEPISYHLMNDHPGESFTISMQPTEGTWVRAENVIHWFRQDRGWLRGVPETTATLPLWSLLRRYTLAVVQNAEITADFTVLLKSLQAPNINSFVLDGDGEPTETDADDWFDSFPVDRGLMTVLPDKYDVTQLDPAQPVSIYDSFVNALVQEASRPLLTPSNYALNNSGQYNMASGNLDRQTYIQSINAERFDCDDEVLTKDLDLWWFEAIRTPGYFGDQDAAIKRKVSSSQELRDEAPEHAFRWDEVPEHVDPHKVAQAIDLLHRAGHISDTDIQEKRFNRRVETHYANLEKQNEWRSKNNLVLESTQTNLTLTGQDDQEGTDTTAPGGDGKEEPQSPTNRLLNTNGNGKHK